MKRSMALALMMVLPCSAVARAGQAPGAALSGSKWIGAAWSTPRDGAEEDGSRPLPIFRRVFQVGARPVRATLRIAGLGQWAAWIAGPAAAHPVLPPGLHGAWTDYRKSVAYETIDVTALLQPGDNVLSVMLGNGMYNVQKTPLAGARHGTRYTKFTGSFGPPKLIAELELVDAAGHRQLLVSDSSWKAARGPLLFDSTYGGEDFDSRLEPPHWRQARFDDHEWTSAAVLPSPGGELVPAMAPDVRVHEIYTPATVSSLPSGRTVFDLGQNIAGIVHLRLHGPAGATLRLIPGELLNSDGSVSQATFHGPMWWSYTLRGDREEEWQPLFDFSGFRYVQADWVRNPWPFADPEPPPPGAAILSLEGLAERSNAPVTGTFESSSDLLNRIHHLILAAMHNNQMSLLMDCPHREKLGWLEQTHLQADGLMFNNDLQSVFRAQDRNMADAQWADGTVPTIAPEYVRFGSANGSFDDSPEWGSAAILEPWWAYSFYGDRAQLQRDYPMMRRYLAALAGRAREGIVSYGLGDWYDIGPKAPGLEQNTSLGVTATLMLVEDAQAMQQIATLLGHPEDAENARTLAATTAAAFNARFWNETLHAYDTGSQTASAMPLALGIVPEQRRRIVLDHLVADIHARHDHVTSGEIGYPYLLRALAKEGRDDVILAMLLRTDPPSYGSQLAAGATALTEAWDANPNSSQDHFMLGAAETWFYRRLGGIDLDLRRNTPDQRLTIRPIALPGVDWVRTGFDATQGHIESDWQRQGARIRYRVTIPAGIHATVVLPHGATAKGRQPPSRSSSELEVRFKVSSGSWTFFAPV